MVAVGDTLDGKYQLVQQIGRGGFGRVYLGRELALDRDVAIKVLNPELAEDDPTFLDRFTEEARHVARLDHHNIVPVYVHGTVGDTAYLVMPYIAGGSLRSILAEAGRLSLGQASNFLGQAATALDYAHGRNVVHRDVKPENMLVRDDGQLLLADFGLAKVVEETHTTASRTIRGTPYYMAPEAWQGKAEKPADVYALGCVLFTMLTGKPPYSGSMEQLLFAHTQSPVPMLTEHFNAPVPPALQVVIARALAKEPADRYPSAGALAQAIQRVVEGDISAYTATVQYGTAPALPPLAAPVHAAPVPVATAPAHTPSAATVPAYDPQAATIHADTPPPVPNPVRRMGRDAIAASVAGVGVVLLLCVVGVALAMAARGTVTSTMASVASASTATASGVAASPTPLAVAFAPTAPVAASPTPLAVAFAPTVAPTATATVAPTATRPPPTATASPGARVRFTGELLLASGRNLDLVPPALQSDDGADFRRWSGSNLLSGYSTSVAIWTGANPPTTAEQCADVVARLALGTSYELPKPGAGLSLCVKTDEGRIAFVALTGDAAANFPATVTVWEKATR